MANKNKLGVNSSLEGKLSASNGLNYALPVVVVAFLFGPVSLVQGMYAKYFGLSLSTIASVMLIARLFDAITDPLIGYISDRYYWRSGSRKPFVIVGGILFILSGYFLYVPFGFDIPDIEKNVSGAYFLLCFLFFYLSYTIFDVPHLAWGREIAKSAQDKNKIYSFRALAISGGMLLFFAVPMLPFFESSSFTPETLAWSVALASVVMVPFIIVCVKAVPDGKGAMISRPTVDLSGRQKFLRLINLVVGNKPFLMFIGAFFFSGAGLGMWFGMMFLFVDVYLGLGENLSLMYVLSYAFSILMVKPWYSIATWLGKKACWSLGMSVMALGMLGSGFLSPNASGPLAVLLCLLFIQGGMITNLVMGPSLLADIIDYGTLKFSSDYGASYFAAYTLLLKINLGLGGAVGFAIASYYGFDPLHPVEKQTDHAIWGLQLSIAWLPAFLTAMSITFITQIPLNKRSLEIIHRRLDR